MVRGTTSDKGWAWVVMFASLGAHLVIGCLGYCVGIIHNVILEHFEESVSYTSWAGSVMLGFMSSAGPFSSYLMNRYSCRVSTMVGGLLLTIGCFGSAFVPSLSFVILLFGVVSGIGVGLTYSASVVVVGFNFQKRRNLASGIAVSGCALGTFIFPPLLTLAEIYQGYRGFFIVLAAISAHQCLFGALYRPSDIEMKQQIDTKRKLSEKEQGGSRIVKIMTPYLSVLRSKAVILMVISAFCTSVGVYLVFLHLPYYVITKNTSPIDAAFLLTITGICGAISRIATGAIGNLECVDEIWIYAASFGILGVSTFLFPLYSFSYGGQVVYAIFLGTLFGNWYAIMNSVNISFVGIEHLATAYGLEMFSTGIGSFVGPLLAGFIVDGGGTYEQSFICAGCSITVGAILGILTKCVKPTKDKETKENIYKPYVLESDNMCNEAYKMEAEKNGHIDINIYTTHF